MRACVFYPKPDFRVLIISWHGPQNDEKRNKTSREPKAEGDKEEAVEREKNPGQMKLREKKNIFGKLVCFTEKLRDEHACRMAIVGGDFNISSKEAKDRIGELRMNAKVQIYSDYQPPKDRHRAKLQDFIVVLPQEGVAYEIVETSVHHQYFKRERPRLFEHPIVRFRLSVSDALPLVEEAGETRTGGQDEQKEESDEEGGENDEREREGGQEETIEAVTEEAEEGGGGGEKEEKGEGGGREGKGGGGREKGRKTQIQGTEDGENNEGAEEDGRIKAKRRAENEEKEEEREKKKRRTKIKKREGRECE